MAKRKTTISAGRLRILEDFRKRETDHMDTIRDSIESRAKEILKRERKARECR